MICIIRHFLTGLEIAPELKHQQNESLHTMTIIGKTWWLLMHINEANS